MAVAGGRIHRHAHEPLVAAWLPQRLRRAALRGQGRQARPHRGRPAGAVQRRQAVHALPRHGGSGEPSRPPEVPPAPRRQAWREQVGAHQLGRGLRRDRGAREQGEGGVRLPRHPVRPRHRPQHRLAAAPVRLHRAGDAQRVQLRLHRVRLLPAAHDRRVGQDGRDRHHRRVGNARAALRRPRVPPPRRHHGVGQRAAEVQRRRLHRPLDRRVHADGHEDHLHRPASDVAGRQGRSLAAGASRHRRRAGHRHAEHRHQRGPGGSRVHRPVDVRLRAAGGIGAGQGRRLGGRDLRRSRRRHPHGSAPVRHGRVRLHPVGPRLRAAALRAGRDRRGLRPHGRDGQHRQPGRQPAHQVRLRHRETLRPGRLQDPARELRRQAHAFGRHRVVRHRCLRLVRRPAACGGDGRALHAPDHLAAKRQPAFVLGHGRPAHVRGHQQESRTAWWPTRS